MQNYRFDRFEYRSIERQLRADGRPVAIGPRTLEVLAVLLERHQAVVTARELLDLVWADSDVEESNVQVQVSLLRRALGRDAVVTVPGRGYRMGLPVQEIGPASLDLSPPSIPECAFVSVELGRMLSGELYDARDAGLVAARRRAQRLLANIDACPIDAGQARRSLFEALFGSLGADTEIMPGLRCDYGFNISIGDRSFVDQGCVMHDCNRISIGNETLLACGVRLCTAVRPLDAKQRRSGLESAWPVSIGDGVWIGEGAIVCPGVTIEDNAVVGPGSVVTRDLPANVFAAGNPCRPQRRVDRA